MYVFKTLNEMRELKEAWVEEYNGERLHDSVGELTSGKIQLNCDKGKTLIPRASNKGCLHCIAPLALVLNETSTCLVLVLIEV